MEKTPKHVKNIYEQLTNDAKSIFFASDKINKSLLNKAKKSVFEKDHVFYIYYKNLENENVLHEDRKHQVPFYTPFVEQKMDVVDRSSALYSINAPFELLHADVVNIHFFFSKSAADPVYVLLTIDLFTSKIYTYLIKKELCFQKNQKCFIKTLNLKEIKLMMKKK